MQDRQQRASTIAMLLDGGHYRTLLGERQWRRYA